MRQQKKRKTKEIDFRKESARNSINNEYKICVCLYCIAYYLATKENISCESGKIFSIFFS